MGWFGKLFTKSEFFIPQQQIIPEPIGTASVGPNAGPPKGYMWDRLASAVNESDLDLLEAHAIAHGYGVDGQLRKAIKAKRASL